MDKFLQCLHLRPRAQPSNGKKKVVLRVQMENVEKRATVMQSLAKWHGVTSIALEGKENNEIAVVGERIDPVCITERLRNKMGSVEMLKVDTLDKEKEKEKDKDKEKEKKKEDDKNKHHWNYYPPPQPVCYYYYDEPTCSIL